MSRFALIGHPVAGSLSPLLFNAAYQGRYPYALLDLPFPQAWAAFLKEYHGINVTAPYKQDAFRSVDHLSPEALETGAVNLAVKADDGIHGYNTDVDGITGAVKEAGFNGGTALIIGAGGAARAAVAAAKRLGCKAVTVANRTHEKAAAMASSMGCQVVPLSDIGLLSPDLIVYTIPGRDGLSEPAMTSPGIPVVTGDLLRNAIVLEAEYKHPALCGVKCRRYISGRRWLLHQAITGYELFTGEKPDSAAMAKAIEG